MNSLGSQAQVCLSTFKRLYRNDLLKSTLICSSEVVVVANEITEGAASFFFVWQTRFDSVPMLKDSHLKSSADWHKCMGRGEYRFLNHFYMRSFLVKVFELRRTTWQHFG